MEIIKATFYSLERRPVPNKTKKEMVTFLAAKLIINVHDLLCKHSEQLLATQAQRTKSCYLQT